jgi:hypothetical protein
LLVEYLLRAAAAVRVRTLGREAVVNSLEKLQRVGAKQGVRVARSQLEAHLGLEVVELPMLAVVVVVVIGAASVAERMAEVAVVHHSRVPMCSVLCTLRRIRWQREVVR